MPPNDFDKLNKKMEGLVIFIIFTTVLIHKIYDMSPMT